MGNLVNYSTSLHQATKREYIKRMVDDKINCMLKAKEYEFDYWDGSRRYGYGGYKYMPGRWKPVAEALIENYNLTNDSSAFFIRAVPRRAQLAHTIQNSAMYRF